MSHLSSAFQAAVPHAAASDTIALCDNGSGHGEASRWHQTLTVADEPLSHAGIQTFAPITAPAVPPSPSTHHHHGIMDALHRIASVFHHHGHHVDGGRSVSPGTATGAGKDTVLVLHLPASQPGSRSNSPTVSPPIISGDSDTGLGLPSSASSLDSVIRVGSSSERSDSAVTVSSVNSDDSAASTASAPAHKHHHNVLYLKFPHGHHLTKESLQHALHTVADKLHQHVHMPHFDWFHHKHRQLNAMATPAGSHTAPIGSIVNLLNGTLGAGILAMPLMFSLMGWVLGLLTLTLTCCLGIFTTRLMVAVGIAERTESYHMTICRTLGKRAMLTFQGLLIAGVLGALMSYLMLIGDFTVSATSQLIPGKAFNRRYCIMIIAVFIVLPLAMLRKVKSLWFTGFMAMTFVAFFVACMVFKAATAAASSSLASDFYPARTNFGNFFRGLPLSFFAYSCHNSVFPVFHEMKVKTLHEFNTVTTANHIITWVLYAMAGMAGYLLFGGTQGGNVLKNFQGTGDDLMTTVTICFLFTIVFVFPMSNFAMRICIHYLWKGETSATPLQHAVETILPFAVVLTGALFITDLGVVYSLIGSVGSTSFFLLFPTALYLKSTALKDRSSLSMIAAKVVFCFGVAFMILGVIMCFAQV